MRNLAVLICLWGMGSPLLAGFCWFTFFSGGRIPPPSLEHRPEYLSPRTTVSKLYRNIRFDPKAKWYDRLRSLASTAQAIEDLNPSVMRALEEISSSDPDPRVRELASEIRQGNDSDEFVETVLQYVDLGLFRYADMGNQTTPAELAGLDDQSRTFAFVKEAYSGLLNLIALDGFTPLREKMLAKLEHSFQVERAKLDQAFQRRDDLEELTSLIEEGQWDAAALIIRERATLSELSKALDRNTTDPTQD